MRLLRSRPGPGALDLVLEVVLDLEIEIAVEIEILDVAFAEDDHPWLESMPRAATSSHPCRTDPPLRGPGVTAAL